MEIARRSINNLRYADDTTLVAENKKELKSLLMKMKEESGKTGLKFKHSKNENLGIWFCYFLVSRWGNNGKSNILYFGELQNHCRW